MRVPIRVTYLGVAVFFVVVLYGLCAIENYGVLQSETLKWLVYEEILSTHEDSFLEVFSAVLWCFAFLLFAHLAFRSLSGYERLWLVFFAALSLFAFGEEISWGHHLFDYSAHIPLVIENNAQGETNLHNINVAALLGLEEDFPYYRYLANLSHLLNPVFYLLLSFLWLGLPLVKISGVFSGYKVISQMPVASTRFMIFFFVHSLAFITVDVLFFNVGYIYEMFVGLAAVLVALDVRRSLLMAVDVVPVH